MKKLIIGIINIIITCQLLYSTPVTMKQNQCLAPKNISAFQLYIESIVNVVINHYPQSYTEGEKSILDIRNLTKELQKLIKPEFDCIAYNYYKKNNDFVVNLRAMNGIKEWEIIIAANSINVDENSIFHGNNNKYFYVFKRNLKIEKERYKEQNRTEMIKKHTTLLQRKTKENSYVILKQILSKFLEQFYDFEINTDSSNPHRLSPLKINNNYNMDYYYLHLEKLNLLEQFDVFINDFNIEDLNTQKSYFKRKHSKDITLNRALTNLDVHNWFDSFNDLEDFVKKFNSKLIVSEGEKKYYTTKIHHSDKAVTHNIGAVTDSISIRDLTIAYDPERALGSKLVYDFSDYHRMGGKYFKVTRFDAIQYCDSLKDVPQNFLLQLYFLKAIIYDCLLSNTLNFHDCEFSLNDMNLTVNKKDELFFNVTLRPRNYNKNKYDPITISIELNQNNFNNRTAFQNIFIKTLQKLSSSALKNETSISA